MKLYQVWARGCWRGGGYVPEYVLIWARNQVKKPLLISASSPDEARRKWRGQMRISTLHIRRERKAFLAQDWLDNVPLQAVEVDDNAAREELWTDLSKT